MKPLAVLVLALAACGCAGQDSAPPSAPTTTIRQVAIAAPKHPTNPKPCKGTVALTFDDGPGIYTPQVLAVLKRWNARSTFFMVGYRVSQRPQLVGEAVKAGHWVANHTYDHKRLSEMNAADQRGQIDRANQVLVANGAPKPKLFRAPFGDSTAEERRYVTQGGMRQVLWSVDPEDWSGKPPASIRAYVLSNAKDGAVVLLHDGMEDTPPNTIAALPAILDGLRARGLCTGPVPADAPEKWGDPGAAGDGAKHATTTTERT